MLEEKIVLNHGCLMSQVAINEAILEAEEDDDEEVNIPSEKESAAPRIRNRPKRKVEPSST